MHERNAHNCPLDLAYFCRRDSLKDTIKAPIKSQESFSIFTLKRLENSQIASSPRGLFCVNLPVSNSFFVLTPQIHFTLQQLNNSPAQLRWAPPLFSFCNVQRLAAQVVAFATLTCIHFDACDVVRSSPHHMWDPSCVRSSHKTSPGHV